MSKNTVGLMVLGLVVLAGLCFSVGLQAAEIRVIAGNGEAGFADGTTDARFNKPIRLAPFGPGKILIADINNHAGHASRC